MPLTLTERQRRRLATRFLAQTPATLGLTDHQRANVLADYGRMVRNLPGDVAFTLFTLADLAEQGNGVAEHLLRAEMERLNLVIDLQRRPRADGQLLDLPSTPGSVRLKTLLSD